MSVARRFPIVTTQFGVVPIAVALLLAWAAYSERPWVRWPALFIAVFTVVAAIILYRARPVLIVDSDGYAALQNGRETFRVAWAEIKLLRIDAAENALFADVGENTRNLLVPPKRGYGFRFERQAELYTAVIDAVRAIDPTRVVAVDKLTDV